MPNTTDKVETRKVVISGAGPAGVLLAIHLLRRNETSALNNGVRYQVTLVDGGQDYGQISQEELSKNRSWMLSLAGHGLEAIRSVPRLFEDFVSKVGIPTEIVSIYLGAKEVVNASISADNQEAFVVDRNFVVAALARYLNEHYTNDPNFIPKYNSKVLFVDNDYQRVLLREDNKKDGEEYMSYDLLIGCDGIRSVVRDAMIKRHRDFECDVGDIFQHFKAVHVKRPDAVGSKCMTILPSCFPNFQGIALPETNGMLNVSIGIPRHLFDSIPEGLSSSDPTVVAKYFRENFKAWDFVDYDDFARQWCAQSWNRTGQVHCSSYHSLPLRTVIMGDAAHATSPSIGMGMNTALADATYFNSVLDAHDDKIEAALPAFSEGRVKVGNSLTDLAMYLNCLSPRHQLVETIHMIARGTLHKWFPSLVTVHPQSVIGVVDYSLSDVYDIATQLGIIQKHRLINDRIRRDYFEAKVGMVKTRKSGLYSKLIMLGIVGTVGVGVALNFLA